jgi:peptidoglycan/LPS O-acetylase OafA/YrhL
LPTNQPQSFKESQAYHWLYATNFGAWIIGNTPFSTQQVNLLHLWSLSIEEQFYLLWPAIVLIVSHRALIGICLSLCASALLLRCLFCIAGVDDYSAYYLTPCRWDGLAAGALVAVLKEQRPDFQRLLWPSRVVATLCAAFLLAFFFTAKGLWPHHWLMKTIGLSIVTAMFAAVLVIILANRDGALGRGASLPVLRFFGKYSYGLYIIHGALMPALHRLIPVAPWVAAFDGWTGLAIGSIGATKLAICTCLAMASFHFYEMPFLRLKRYFSQPELRPGGAIEAEQPPPARAAE